MKITIRFVRDKHKLERVQKIREVVFTNEQKISAKLDRDGKDNEAEHIIAKDGSKTIGTARIRFIDDNAKVERLALLKEYRGKGIGKQILRYAVNYCKKKRVKEVVLHAQCYAMVLFERLGFEPRGQKLGEVGIDHIEMSLDTRGLIIIDHFFLIYIQSDLNLSQQKNYNFNQVKNE